MVLSAAGPQDGEGTCHRSDLPEGRLGPVSEWPMRPESVCRGMHPGGVRVPEREQRQQSTQRRELKCHFNRLLISSLISADHAPSSPKVRLSCPRSSATCLILVITASFLRSSSLRPSSHHLNRSEEGTA